jgi:hypothetical protein
VIYKNGYYTSYSLSFSYYLALFKRKEVVIMLGLDTVTTIWVFIAWPGVIVLGIVIGLLYIGKMELRRKPEGRAISGYGMTLGKKEKGE